MLHLPLRGVDQVIRKYETVSSGLPEERVGGHIARAVDAAHEGTVDKVLRALGADGTSTAEGLESGYLVRDTRLRDALRALAGVSSLPRDDEAPAVFARPGEGRRIEFPRPSIVDEARFAVEAAVVAEADHVRALRRLDELEGRVRELERQPRPRLSRLLRRLGGRSTSTVSA